MSSKVLIFVVLGASVCSSFGRNLPNKTNNDVDAQTKAVTTNKSELDGVGTDVLGASIGAGLGGGVNVGPGVVGGRGGSTGGSGSGLGFSGKVGGMIGGRIGTGSGPSVGGVPSSGGMGGFPVGWFTGGEFGLPGTGGASNNKALNYQP